MKILLIGFYQPLRPMWVHFELYSEVDGDNFYRQYELFVTVMCDRLVLDHPRARTARALT